MTTFHLLCKVWSPFAVASNSDPSLLAVAFVTSWLKFHVRDFFTKLFFSRAVVLNRGSYAPLGTFGNVFSHSVGVWLGTGVVPTGIWWRENKDTAKSSHDAQDRAHNKERYRETTLENNADTESSCVVRIWPIERMRLWTNVDVCACF